MSSGPDSPDVSQWEIPHHFTEQGVVYPGAPFSPEALGRIRAGDVPPYDVLIATYPRSGTAKLVEICWLLLHGCDTEKARTTDVAERHMFLEWLGSPALKNAAIEQPVVAKTHVTAGVARMLVGSNQKVIVGIRNPKDTLVSYYHFNRMHAGHGLFPGNWDQFMDFYKKNRFPYGEYFDHVLSWWAERERENIMVVMFEDLHDKPLTIIKEMSQFLGQNHSEEDLQKVAEWTSFANISKQPASNYTAAKYQGVFKPDISTYMRKGTPGDWKNYFRDEDNEYIEGLCQSRARPVDLVFRFESAA